MTAQLICKDLVFVREQFKIYGDLQNRAYGGKWVPPSEMYTS